MDRRNSHPRERIIPIQLEEDQDTSEDQNEKDSSFTSIDSGGQPDEASPNRRENSDIPSTSSSSESPHDINDIAFKRTLPYADSKEKIVIIIDSAEDENCTPFKLNNASLKPLDMIKRGVEMFLHHKHRISRRKDEFALVILNENHAIWLLDFTSNIGDVISSLENIGSCETEDVFDLDKLFDVISEHVVVPEVCRVEEMPIPPSYVVRSILFYARSYTVPKISSGMNVRKLLEAPYYTFDILMTHEPFDSDNNCDKISNILQSIDQKGFANFFPVTRDAKELFDSVGKLLAHPLQRPVQKMANHSLKHYVEKYNM